MLPQAGIPCSWRAREPTLTVLSLRPRMPIPCSWRAREPTAENNVSHFQTFRRLWFKPLTTAKTPRRQKCHLGVLVEATGFEPTTSWSRTASEQSLYARRCVPRGVAAWLVPPFPAHPHSRLRGSPEKERAWPWGQEARPKPQHKQKHRREKSLRCFWSRRRDLNPRPLGPEPSALPNCATPRTVNIISNRTHFCKRF